jgi:hypothetical protein
MIDNPQLRIKPTLPFKSVATALLFSVLLGPVGLLYSSVIGGSILMVLFLIAFTGKYANAMIIFWFTSSIISVATVNRYNNKIIKKLTL